MWTLLSPKHVHCRSTAVVFHSTQSSRCFSSWSSTCWTMRGRSDWLILRERLNVSVHWAMFTFSGSSMPSQNLITYSDQIICKITNCDLSEINGFKHAGLQFVMVALVFEGFTRSHFPPFLASAAGYLSLDAILSAVDLKPDSLFAPYTCNVGRLQSVVYHPINLRQENNLYGIGPAFFSTKQQLNPMCWTNTEKPPSRRYCPSQCRLASCFAHHDLWSLSERWGVSHSNRYSLWGWALSFACPMHIYVIIRTLNRV